MRGILAAILDTLVNRPVSCAVLVLVLVVGLGSGLPALKMDSSSTGLIVQDDPATLAYEKIKASFGDDVAITVIYRSDSLFSPEVLSSLDDVSFALEDLDGVTRVVSLSTVSDLRGDGQFLYTNPIMAYPPETQQDADAIREHALANELLTGEVVGRDGRSAALHAFIEDRRDDQTFERRTLNAIEAILDRQRARLGADTQIYVSGAPVVSLAVVDNLVADATTLAPVSITAVGIALLVFFRAPIVIVMPLVTGFCSVVATLGLMGLIGFDINPVSIIIPSLLLVVGATEDIHLISEYAVATGAGKHKKAAVRATLRVCGLAIVLTSLTTTIGFLTLAPHGIPMISEFGVAASVGMAINLIITVLLMPAVAYVMPRTLELHRTEFAIDRRLKAWLIHIVLHHRRWIFAGSLIFVGVSGALATRVVVDEDLLSFFAEDSEVRSLLRQQSRDISGPFILLAEIDTHRAGGVQNPAALAEIARLTDFLAARHDDVISYDLLIRKAHKELNGGDPAFFVTPEDSDLIAQYMLLMEPETLSRFANFDMSRALILVRTGLSGSKATIGELAVLQDFVTAEIAPTLSVRFSGSQVLAARSADRLSREVILNLGYVSAAIFVLMALLFSSVRAGLLSLVPNTLPIIGVFGAMGLLGVPLDTTVFPVAIIALGLAVDDTIHFMTRYAADLRVHETNEAAIRATIGHEFRPVVSSSAALTAGILTLTFASFGSVQQFGILASVAVMLAVVADLVVTPALLVTTPLVSTWDRIRLRLSPGFEQTSAFMRGLTPREMRRVAALAVTRRFPDGGVMLRQGEEGRDMYLILKGTASVSIGQVDGRQTPVGAAGAGTVVGEMGFLTGQPRAASVVAAEPVEAIQISARTIDRISSRYPRIANKLLHNIAVVLTERLKAAQTRPTTPEKDA